jgi:hypothetical protein
LRAEGFFCSLGVLDGGLGISKLQFLIKNIKIKISSLKFFSILGHQTRIRNPDPQLEKMLDPDPHKINADPQPCALVQILIWIGLFIPIRIQGAKPMRIRDIRVLVIL